MKRKNQGFTLVELLVVVTLLSGVMVIMLGSGSFQNWSAQNAAARITSDFSTIENAFIDYNADKNAYPASLTDPTFSPQYLFAPQVPNGWDNAYGTYGYVMGHQTGQVSPNNGYYVCVRANGVAGASDQKWQTMLLMGQQYSPAKYFINTSCPSVSNMTAPAFPSTVYATLWLTRN